MTTHAIVMPQRSDGAATGYANGTGPAMTGGTERTDRSGSLTIVGWGYYARQDAAGAYHRGCKLYP